MTDITSPVPEPAAGARAPGVSRAIYGMPMFATLAARDIGATVSWYTGGLDFIELFTVPGPGGGSVLVHLRRWQFQDLLVRPAHEPVTPGVVDHKGQQVARRRVNPMDILNDQQHRLSGGQPRKHAIYGLKQLRPIAGTARLRSRHGPHSAQRRTQRRLKTREHLRIQHHRPQRGDDRGESKLALGQRQALTGQHSQAGRPSAGPELRHQPALPDARLTLHQHRGAITVPGPRQHRVKRGQLRATPHERR